MRAQIIALAPIFCLLLQQGAQAETRTLKRSVPKGQDIRLTVHAEYGATCDGNLKPKITIVTAPKNGNVSVRNSLEAVDKPGTPCHGRQVPGIGVFYKSSGAFRGEDRVVYDRLSPSGQVLFRVDAKIRVD